MEELTDRDNYGVFMIFKGDEKEYKIYLKTKMAEELLK